MAKLTGEQYRALRGRYGVAKTNRDQEWLSHWRDISNYIEPRQGRFEGRDDNPAKGGPRTSYIVDSTATRAASITAAGMKGGLVPHSLPWFKMGLVDGDLARWAPAKDWLATVESRLYATFSRSNFYSAVHPVFHEEILFGTGPFYVAEDAEKDIWCRPWTAGEYVLFQDESGRVDTAFRRYYETLRNLSAKFGEENLPEASRVTLKTNPDKYVEVIHAIFPRRDYDPGKRDSTNMPWGSVHYEAGSSLESPPLGESGFHTCPAMFPRWTVIGESVYGSSCPGIEVLPEVKMLQKMKRDFLELVEKTARPPMLVPDSFRGRLSMLPGAQNVMAANSMDQAKPAYQVAPDLGPLREEIMETREEIRRGFFNDLFLMILNDKDMTATEVVQRHEDKLAILGPVIERQNSELLSPLIDRVFDIMERSGKLPPPPKELAGQEIRVEYVSLLAQAQKMVGSQVLEKNVAFLTMIAQVNPEVVDKYDLDEIAEQFGEKSGLSPKALRTKEQVADLRQGRADQMQQQAAAAMAQQAAVTAKDLSSTKLSGDSALDGVLGQLGGGASGMGPTLTP